MSFLYGGPIPKNVLGYRTKQEKGEVTEYFPTRTILKVTLRITSLGDYDVEVVFQQGTKTEGFGTDKETAEKVAFWAATAAGQ